MSCSRNLQLRRIYLPEFLASHSCRPKSQKKDYEWSLWHKALGEMYLEDCLELCQIWPRTLTSQHLDDKATDAPYISLSCVRLLLNGFRSHPEDCALERLAVATAFGQSLRYEKWRWNLNKNDQLDTRFSVDEINDLTFFNLLRNTEIGNLDSALVVH